MPGVLERYAQHLPLSDATPRISLGEGSTPCVASTTIGSQLGLRSLHFKLEGLNPTGSFKDRGMVVAVAKALEEGSRAIVCASTGNTSASAAAYGARFGLTVGVLVPAG
ncbi:MAG TPA: pyridoxal-phosphate dependent enzyme, partial [Candidatus Dormibacteraeota bacterium]|nr:pyridoxal-phosphate dependent enzyme [Candidatus Dormibacteraeota bacterium]